MILDSLENRVVYSKLNPRIYKGLQYLYDTNLGVLPPGKYELEGSNLYVVVTDYKTKPAEECKLEAHRKYIDIQYLSSGCEKIGVTLLDKQIPTIQYSEEKDVMFFREDVSYIVLKKGVFAIFFPWDLHMPGVMCDEISEVRKVVIKVKI